MSHATRFTAEKIKQRLKIVQAHVFNNAMPLSPFRIVPLADAWTEPPVEADHSGWEEIPHRSYWGGPNLNFLMRSHFTVPTEWEGNLALHLPLGEAGDIFTHPEGLVYIDGKPIASADRYHHTVPLPAHVHDGQRHQIALHGWTGLSGWPPDPNSNSKLYMETCRLVTRHRPTQFFLWLANAALGTAEELRINRSERHGILTALDRAFLTLDTRDPIGDAFYASVPEALEQLRSDLAQAGGTQDVTLHAIGHAHMDIAYLWPVSQMRRKVARTTSNALRLMDEYRSFRFSNSQAVLYQFLEEDYPDLFDRIRMAVARGQWEVMGGMWVEPDVNLAGPEALVRQITLARRYFQRHFGEAETPVLWLPDTFGFPWCLPQLMAQAGLRWFCTNKLNWNQVNRLPSSTFRWQGMDGTQVLAHVLTTPREVQYLPFPTNYKSDLSAPEVLGTWDNSTAKHCIRDLPVCFGYGDGGGGPTEGLIQTAMAYGEMPGMPHLRMSTVRDTFEAMEQSRERVPVWNDELYFEGHRGVLTSNGWIKRENRLAEVALHGAEALAATYGFPARLGKAWELLCLNQFHDILTGTAIREVFEDAAQDYRAIHDFVGEALRPLPSGATTVHNLAPARVAPVVTVPRDAAPGGAQPVADGALIQMPKMEPYESLATSAAVAPEPGLSITQSGGEAIMENTHTRVVVNFAGQLTSLYDKTACREVLAEGHLGNQLQAFEDRPIVWDAWDIDPFFEDRLEALDDAAQIEVIEDGPIRAALRVSRPFRNSRITQTIRLTAGSPQIDFVTEIDWHETHTLLKVAFPVDVLSTRATYGIQWGSIERPTHRNTPWDAARFEVCGHGWADLSDGGYGVALLSDCKYGYDIRDNVMRLSLIKSATMPDTGADQGLHQFTYALLPHAGDWRGVAQPAAAALIHPPRLSGAKPTSPPLTCDHPGVVIQTLAPSHDGSAIIARLYEANGAKCRATVTFSGPVENAEVCDLLENTLHPLDVEKGQAHLEFKPHQIITVKWRRA
ncbi:MAG: glycoside hydrolase family 38 C-terminal domain-containing protein [Pseudomonadota bacterium]